MKKPRLTSKIWLNDTDKSAFFLAKVINNPDTHEKVKQVPKEFIKTKGKFAAYIYDHENKLVFKVVDTVHINGYIDFIMDYTYP